MYLILSAEKPRALENIKVDKQLFEKKITYFRVIKPSGLL